MPGMLLALLAALPMPGWTTTSEALARRYAPVMIAETRTDGANVTQDLPVPFDFDGDWNMSNNWDHQPRYTATATPTVHYAAVATANRAYLTYYVFYPRDWERFCLPFVCHENDLEQFTLVIDNDGSRDGRPLLMDVKFHMGARAYPVAGAGATPLEQTAARLSLGSDGRPIVRVESGGHGVASCDMNGDGRLDSNCLNPDDAQLLAPAGAASPVLERTLPRRTYELVSIRDTLWQHRQATSGVWTKDAFAYDGTRLGRHGAALGVSFDGSGPGGGARAPWGVRPKDRMKAGDRFFDPAMAIAARWNLPGGVDHLPYVEHRFLDDLTHECEGPDCAAAPLVARNASRK
jgi:hypothetical protein